jgi:hypothetical protein
MCVRRVASAKYLAVGFAISTFVIMAGAASQANAQADLVDRLAIISPSITVLRPEGNFQQPVGPPPDTPCRLEGGNWYKNLPGRTNPRVADPRLTDPKLADRAVNIIKEAYYKAKAAQGGKLTAEDLIELPKREEFIKLPEGVADTAKIFQRMTNDPKVAKYKRVERDNLLRFLQQVAAPLPQIFNCITNPQPRTVKISFPFNPTYETNVLKSDSNVHSDGSLGFGGSVLVTGPGFAPYDVVGFNVSSASARYSAFPSKSLDALTEQGIYQIYLGGYHNDGITNGTPIDPKYGQIPNLLTVDTLALGFVNQTAYLPGYRVETADLFTPQFTLARSNMALSGNICSTADAKPAQLDSSRPLDPSKPLPWGSCYYVDLALTVGQTFSDVLTQQNFNVAVSATPGWRIDNTDWKITLPIVATAREYENVLGGRQDVLFQIGPTGTYSLPATKPGDPSLMFSLAATYNRNYSTLSTVAWHGYIIQPTLTIAFAPPPPVK